MELFLKNIGHLVLMLIILGLSAFFSGCETAFFNLTSRQIRQMKMSRNHLTRLAASVINQPGELLNCLLFGNMFVNVLYFALASVVTVRIQQQLGTRAAAVTAFLFFSILVLFGELLPKSFAYINSKAISTAASVPAYLSLKIFTPFIWIFNFTFVAPVLRLMLGPVQKSKTITENEFRSLIKQIKKRGLITADQNRLINEIIELGTLKVRDCLKPRVDMTACSVMDRPETIRKIMTEHHLTKIPVYVGKLDNIIGLIYLRHLLLEPQESIDKLVQPAHFIPEQKSIESLLEFFRKTHTDTVVVVDEYGGIAGTISLEDIAEELLGPIETKKQVETIESIGPFQYRLSGDVPIRDWADAFDIDLEEARITTIGGLVTALLGKIPQNGDVVNIGNLKFTVEKIQRRRIKTIVMTFGTIRTR